ncbi:MAG: NAD/NADP-dependent betaine aldehyde dehydrogenase [Holosporales bacterium]
MHKILNKKLIFRFTINLIFFQESICSTYLCNERLTILSIVSKGEKLEKIPINSDIEERDINGFRALHLASSQNSTHNINFLLDNGADIHALNKNDNTPLHCAAYRNNREAIIVLHNRKANIDAQNRDGDTPLMSAAWKNSAIGVKTLIELGANLFVTNKDGDNALHLAVWNSSIDSVKELINYNLHHIKNNDGDTPVDFIFKKQIHSMFSLFFNILLPFDRVNLIALQLSFSIKMHKNELITILSDYQTKNVTEYEIERSVKTLENLNNNRIFFERDKLSYCIASMLPSNLPLYSFILFGVIPGLICDRVYIRPNNLLQESDIIVQIFHLLNIADLLPSILVVGGDRSLFEPYIKLADLVIFTGQSKNAEKILGIMKNNALLVINGSGHNPVVVTDTADIDQSVQESIFLKSFNSGQDCAGPDAILIHEKIAEAFISKFVEKFSELRIGSLDNLDSVIAPISRLDELQKFSCIFYHNAKDILLGGSINFKTRIVNPTVIVRDIKRDPNFKEMFGPVAFIHTYQNDDDLEYYFEDTDGMYQSNRMYVSVFGHSNYIAERDDSITPGYKKNVGIVLYNKTVHDVESGWLPYGGYSLNASAVIKKQDTKLIKRAMPILIPEIICKYLLENNPIEENINHIIDCRVYHSIITGDSIQNIVEEFKNIVTSIFKDNLLFGFVFGSAAHGKIRLSKSTQDDLDTFICLKNLCTESKNEYIKRIRDLQEKYSLSVDEIFPAEIIIKEDLEKTISELPLLDFSIHSAISGKTFDYILWVHALTGKKTGIVGNNEIMVNYIRQIRSYVKKWSVKILEELGSCTEVPLHIKKKFTGLSKEEILQKLRSYSPHLIIHLGLNYEDQ